MCFLFSQNFRRKTQKTPPIRKKEENIPAPAEETIEEAKNETVANSEPVQAADSTDKSQALWSELMAQEDEKQAEIKKNGLIQKLPIFEYGDAKEEIMGKYMYYSLPKLIVKAERVKEICGQIGFPVEVNENISLSSR